MTNSSKVAKKPVSGEVLRVGRPPKLTKLEREEVYQALEYYIDSTVDPKIVGFVSVDPTALRYKVTDDNINDWEEFSRLRKRAVKKQEWYLLEAGGTGRYNPTMAIFRLKQPQHGYTDKVVQEQNINMVQPIIALPEAKKVIDE